MKCPLQLMKLEVSTQPARRALLLKSIKKKKKKILMFARIERKAHDSLGYARVFLWKW